MGDKPVNTSCLDKEELKDELDGFRTTIVEKLKCFFCVSSTLSPRSSPTGYNEFTDNKTALNAKSAESHHYEMKSSVVDEDTDTYKFTYPKRGLALIINNEKFSMAADFSDRPGSKHDADALEDTFHRLGFDVLVENNLTSKQIAALLLLVSKRYDHLNADCFVCVVLTHGDETLIVKELRNTRKTERNDLLFGVDGVAIATRVVVEAFNDDRCPNLKGKPRLFFFQACRGNKLDDGTDIVVRQNYPKHEALTAHHPTSPPADLPDASVLSDSDSCLNQQKLEHKTERDCKQQEEINKDETDAPTWQKLQNIPVNPAPLYKDCLVMYATPPGYFAWRRRTGAWFVQSLCMMLKSSGLGTMSFVKALVLVNKYVAMSYQSDNPAKPRMDAKKEMPVIQSMLVKDIFMTAKKHV